MGATQPASLSTSSRQGRPRWRINLSSLVLPLVSVSSVVLVLLVWYLLTQFSVVPPLFLPSPGSVMARFQESQADVLSNIGSSLLRIAAGFCLGSGLGLLVAILGGLSRAVRDVLEPVIQILKPIPAIAMAPFAILWFGIGFSGILFLVAWGCFFITVVDASEAIKNVPKYYIWAASALGTSRIGIYLRVVLPSILPNILGGLRVAMVIAFNQTILGEFNTASGGIGQTIIQGYLFGQTEILFVGIILTIIVAVIVDQLLVRFGRWLTRWAI